MICDRVINVREGYTVPLGYHGTIIGISKSPKVQDIIYEVLFDEPFVGAFNIRGSDGKGYKMPGSALINISFGKRKFQTVKFGFANKKMTARKMIHFLFRTFLFHEVRNSYLDRSHHSGEGMITRETTRVIQLIQRFDICSRLDMNQKTLMCNVIKQPQNKPKNRPVSDDTEYQRFWSDLAEKSKISSPKILQREPGVQKLKEKIEDVPSLADAAKKLPIPETPDEKKEKDPELSEPSTSTAVSLPIPMSLPGQMPRGPMQG